jgi:hypothetical protein
MIGSATFDASGLDALERRLEKAAAFDFTTTGEAGESVGREARVAAGAAMLDRFLAAKGPNGRGWARLSPSYRRWKARGGHPTRIGVLTGQSGQERQFLGGPTTVAPTEVVFSYGVTAYSRRVMGFFHFGTGRQPARPFWAGDRAVRAKVVAVVREGARRHLRRAMRGEI